MTRTTTRRTSRRRFRSISPACEPDCISSNRSAVANPLTRSGIKALIERRYSTRLHMSMILAACGLTAMATSWSLLHVGVHSMLVRYPLAISLAYGTFLVGVWIWLRITTPFDASAPGRRASGGIDLGIPSGGGGGGGSGGGGLG